MDTDAGTSKWSIASQDSFLCIGCKGSVLAVMPWRSRRSLMAGTPA